MADEFEQLQPQEPSDAEIDSFVTQLRTESEQRAFDRPMTAALAGAARGLSFGLSDVALTKTGVVNPETLRKLREYNPMASITGEVGGIVAPALLSGGTSLLAQGARGAGLAVKGVSALGAATESAILTKLGTEAAKTTARNVLERVAATGARGAVEGGFYGAGQIVSESAIGDVPLTAEKVLGTVGLSVLLGGGANIALSSAGAGMKALYEKAQPIAKKVFKQLRGVSDDTYDLLLKQPEAIKQVEGLGQTVEESLANYAQETSVHYQDKRSVALGTWINEIQDKIATANADKTTRVSVSDLISGLKQTKSKLTPEGVSVTPEIERAISQIDVLENNLINLGKFNYANEMSQEAIKDTERYLGIRTSEGFRRAPRIRKGPTKTTDEILNYVPEAEGAEVSEWKSPFKSQKDWVNVRNWIREPAIFPTEIVEQRLGPEDIFILPSQLNIIRKQANDAAKAVYSTAGFVRTPGADVYDDLANIARKHLDEISPDIRKINSRIGSLIESEKTLSRYGLAHKEVEPEKMARLLRAGPVTKAATERHLQIIDDLIGTDLTARQKIAVAVKELNPNGGLWSQLKTGYALMAPAAGALLGLPMGPAGAATLGLAGLAMQAPFATRGLVKYGSKLDDIMRGIQAPPILAKNQVFSGYLIPFVGAKIAGLKVLQDQAQAFDQSIDSAIQGSFGQTKPVGRPPSPASLDMWAPLGRFSDSSVKTPEQRQRAFEKTIERMIESAANPELWMEKIGANLADLSLVAPKIGQEIAAKATNQLQFLAQKAPKNPHDPLNPAFQDWKPSDHEIAKFSRYLAAVDRPQRLVEELRDGVLVNETVEAIRNLYPQYYAQIVSKIMDSVVKNNTKLSFNQRKQLGILLGQPVDQAIKNVALFQQSYQAPQAMQQQGFRPSALGKSEAVENRRSATERIENR